MAEQLNLLGELSQPADEELGPVQRETMRELRRLGTLSREEAGAIAHEHRGKHSRDERCAWCATDGSLVLESLFRRKHAEPGLGGDARLPQTKAKPFDQDIPY